MSLLDGESFDRKEILKKVRHLDIRLRSKSRSVMSGAYRSAFKGRGMVFSDFREYIPGDDVRAISWTLTAKMSRPYIKTFEEDREAQILLALDLSASMDFGTGQRSKKSVSAVLSAVLAFCAQKNSDSLGLLIFSNRTEIFLQPKKDPRRAFHIVKEICGFKRKHPQTDIGKGLAFLSGALKKRSCVFVFSDFLRSPPFEKPLKQLAQKHDVILVVISDPSEQDAPPLGLVNVEDLETGDQRVVDFSSPSLREKFRKNREQQITQRDKIFARSRCDRILIDCQKDIYKPLAMFFGQRANRR